MRTKSFRSLALAISAIPLLAGMGLAQSSRAQPHCQAVAGMIMTNLGAVDQSTTLGVVDGDLRGAVAATIQSVIQQPDGTFLFTVQHHFVTQAGDTILSDPAAATTREVAPGLFAVLKYPVHITGGTGKYSGATGDLNNIGAADLNAGRTVFRYFGQICFAAPNTP